MIIIKIKVTFITLIVSLSYKTYMRKEFILCAAIDYNGIIVSGRRHTDCYNILNQLTNIEDNLLPDRDKQGFLTSTGRFVDRKIAFIIAKENGQIFHKMYDNDSSGSLTSEDLYYDDEIDNV